MFITVINGKRTYNLSEIMRQAWVAFRTSKQTFSECLKRAWATAKSVMCSILAVENEAEQAAKSVEQFKNSIRSASSEREIEEILDEAMDALDASDYAKVLNFAYTVI